MNGRWTPAGGAALLVACGATEPIRATAAEARSVAPEVAMAEAVTSMPVDEDARLLGTSGRYVFRSTRGDDPQLWIGDRTGATPSRALTALEGGVGDFALTADGAAALVAYDRDGTNRPHFLRVGLERADVRDLTPGPEETRFGPFVAVGRADRFFYEVRAKDELGLSVMAQPVEASAPAEPVFRLTGVSGWLRDVSDDGRAGLVLALLALSERAVLVADFETGGSRRLYPPAAQHLNITATRFAPGGENVLVATDAGGDGSALLLLDRTSGRELARYVEKLAPHGAIVAIEPNASSGRIAISVSAGDHSEIRLLDARTLRLEQTISLPLGSGYALASAGDEVTVTWSTADSPPAVLALDARSGAIVPLAGVRAARAAGITTRLERIPSFDGVMIPLNVYLPPGAARRPVVVFVHGGPTAASSIEWSTRTEFFLRAGFAVVEPNLRGSSGFGRAYELADDGPKRPDVFRDLACVRRWIAAMPWADASRIVLQGQSYGGYVVLYALATQPDLWRAGIDLYGISSWPTFLHGTNPGTRAMFSIEVGSPERDALLLDALSPLTHAANIRAPLFVYHGENDYQVPVAESAQIATALRARGARVELMIAPEEGHGMAKRSTQVEFLGRVARFLVDALDLPGWGDTR